MIVNAFQMQVKGGHTTARGSDFVSFFKIYFRGIDLFLVYLHFKNHYRGIPWNNAFWPTAVAVEADCVNLVSTSACHIGGPKQSCIKFKKVRSRSVHHNDLREKIKIKFTGISDLDLSFQLTMT